VNEAWWDQMAAALPVIQSVVVDGERYNVSHGMIRFLGRYYEVIEANGVILTMKAAPRGIEPLPNETWDIWAEWNYQGDTRYAHEPSVFPDRPAGRCERFDEAFPTSWPQAHPRNITIGGIVRGGLAAVWFWLVMLEIGKAVFR